MKHTILAIILKLHNDINKKYLKIFAIIHIKKKNTLVDRLKILLNNWAYKLKLRRKNNRDKISFSKSI